MNDFGGGGSWRYTALTPKLFFLDARAVFPLGLWLLHWSDATFAAALISVAFLIATDKLGLPLSVAPARVRMMLVGRLRPAGDTLLFRRRSRF
jgi:intracellular multiplication protein IcmT